MRILFFIESLLSGGKERRMIELIKELVKLKEFKIEIVSTREGVHYKDILDTDVKIHFLLRKNGKRDPSLFYKFYKISRKFKPDIIHVWGNLVAVYAIPTKLLQRIPIINNQIADVPTTIDNSLLGPRITFPFSDKIIANSKAGLKAYNAPVSKSSVIYNGFNYSRLSKLEDENNVRKKLNVDTKYVVGMVATFYHKKDYETYINAAQMILSDRKDVTFLCIGAGDYTLYENQVQSDNVNFIRFFGKQQSVENIMNICDIGVLSTFTEGIPNTILEFMALKKPVVVTGGGGCIEIIENNKNGYILNTGDQMGLAGKINYLLDNENIKNEFGIYSEKIVKEKFSISKMIELFVAAYTEVKN